MSVRRGLWRIPAAGMVLDHLWRLDAARKVRWIAPHLPSEGRILEIGSGPGGVVAALRAAGRDVVAVDRQDSAVFESERPLIADGAALPFADGAFEAALLLTVLHHVPDPDALLAEAARVAGRVLVVEDVYRGAAQRIATKIADSVVNLEFVGHPHANRDDAGWRAAFAALDLTCVHADDRRLAGVFRQALYVLDAPLRSAP